MDFLWQAFQTTWMQKVCFFKLCYDLLVPRILWNFSCFWYIFETNCVVSSLSLHKLPLFHLIYCNGCLIWTWLWVLKVSLLFWIAPLTLLFNHACFLLVFLKYFFNNVINLLKVVMHHILHQKQEICPWVSQIVYNHVLGDSMGTKAFYTQIIFFSLKFSILLAPIIFHDFLPFLEPLLCCPINFSLFSSFFFPEKKNKQCSSTLTLPLQTLLC